MITWRLHIEMIEAKAFRTFIRIYSIFKCERFSANIKLDQISNDLCLPSLGISGRHQPHKIAAPPHKVLRITGNFPRCKLARDLHAAFNLPYVYDYITKLCRRQAESMQNHENEHVRCIAQGEARQR
jgi:hypothetical protein